MADIQQATQLANMQIPEGWAAYQAQQSVEQDQFFQSGVIKRYLVLLLLLLAVVSW